MVGAISDEKLERVKRQNLRKISGVIGNPPYNANQWNENDNNKIVPTPTLTADQEILRQTKHGSKDQGVPYIRSLLSLDVLATA